MAAKAEQWKLRDRLVRVLPQDLARTLPRSFEPMAMAEWAGSAVQRQGAAFYGKLLTLFLCCYFLADLTALLIGNYIPEPPPVRVTRSMGIQRRAPTLEDYQVIFTRNLFNSQGIIPGEETGAPVADPGGAPVKSTLPFNLIGTIIMRNELRSIATIEDKSASTVYPVRVDDEIPNKARILSIEPERVVFLNTTSNRREYIEMPRDPNSTAPRINLGTGGGSGGGGGPKGAGIERVSPTQFNVPRNEVDAALKDLNKVLTEARAVPNFENGLPAGYKLFQIVPGSIYDKLGLQNGDVLCGLNGQAINDPGKAFEMLSELKTANHLELCVKRDGKQMNNSYDIN